MKSKILLGLFLFSIISIFTVFFITRKNHDDKDKSLTRAKIIAPKTSVSDDSDSENNDVFFESEKYETFVPLYSGETLISTLTVDLNNDGDDDEVIIIRKANTPFLYLVAAIIDSDTGVYKRLEPIQTQFTKTKTFSYNGMDITGEHKTALIYQGLADNGNYVMKIYHCHTVDGEPQLVNIGDFSCDGTVFIQQVDRSDAYALSLAEGKSYSVWVYKSEKAASDNQKVQNQIQQEYKWNAITKKYELSQEIKVAASRLVAKELSRIQDGTVETFAGFLDGLWYKTSNDDGDIRYLFFNYKDSEIIQLYKDIQEVYEWGDNRLRHNGMYINSVNADIMNLHRHFDVALVGIDEISVKLRDDINLNINEKPLWDGQYKKMSMQSNFIESDKDSDMKIFVRELKKGPSWSSFDSMMTIVFDDCTYTLQTNDVTESGVYVTQNVGNYNVIQFRSDSEMSYLSENYSIEFGIKTVTETVKNKTIEKEVVDYDTIYLVPIKINSTDCFAVEGKSYIFTRTSL